MANQGWVSIDECISAYIDEGEMSNQKYFKLWHIAFRIMTQLGIDFFYSIRSHKLPINPNLTAELPANCLNWTKVGLLNGGGEIIPLKYNDKLTTYAEFSPDRLQKTQSDTLYNYYLDQVPVWYNYWAGGSFMNLYGVPSGAPFVGGFKVDREAGLIILNENYGYDYLMLECVSSPQMGLPYFVPLQFKEAMISGIAWYDIKSIPAKTHVHNSNVGSRRKEFYNERRLGWARYRPLNLMEAYEWWQSTNRLTVKM